MFALACKFTHSVQALFSPFRKSSISSSNTSNDKLRSNTRVCLPSRRPGVVYQNEGGMHVVHTRLPRVSVKEIVARFDANTQPLTLSPNLPKISSESDTRALRMPRQTRASRVSVMEVACRFQTDERTRGLEVKQALTNIVARLV